MAFRNFRFGGDSGATTRNLKTSIIISATSSERIQSQHFAMGNWTYSFFLSSVLLFTQAQAHAQNLPSTTQKGSLAQTHPVTSQELSAAIEELRSGKHEVQPDANKDDAGLHLVHLLRRSRPDQVDDRTIADIESLLDSSDDYIRFWAAASLGELGPRAKVALPKLLKLLPVVDCIRGDLTSAGAVREALMKIGNVKPPFPSCKKP